MKRFFFLSSFVEWIIYFHDATTMLCTYTDICTWKTSLLCCTHLMRNLISNKYFYCIQTPLYRMIFFSIEWEVLQSTLKSFETAEAVWLIRKLGYSIKTIFRIIRFKLNTTWVHRITSNAKGSLNLCIWWICAFPCKKNFPKDFTNKHMRCNLGFHSNWQKIRWDFHAIDKKMSNEQLGVIVKNVISIANEKKLQRNR